MSVTNAAVSVNTCASNDGRQTTAVRPIRALSLHQPWATLIAIGAKRVETRSWRPTSATVPWPLAVHAAKALPRAARELCQQEPFRKVLAAAGYEDPALLPRGVVVAVCRVIAVRPTAGEDVFEPSLDDLGGWTPAPQELAFGDYSPGRFAWLLGHVTALAEPVPARGSQGVWTWTPPNCSSAGEASQWS